MFPEPSSLLPKIPWIIVSDLLGKAAHIFFYCTFSSPLPLVVLPPYYCIRDPDFFTQNFLMYIKFDALENYILIIFPYLFYATAI